MQPIVLVPVFVYNNKSLNTQSVSKQELPKHQVDQNPTHQTDLLRNEIKKKLFAKADSLVDKTLSCPRTKLSNSQTTILDAIEAGVLLLNKGVEKTQTFRHLHEFTWQSWNISNSRFESECRKQTEANWVPFKVWTSEAAEFVHAGWCCLWVCVQFSESWQSISIKGDSILTTTYFVCKIYAGHKKCKKMKASARFGKKFGVKIWFLC